MQAPRVVGNFDSTQIRTFYYYDPEVEQKCGKENGAL